MPNLVLDLEGFETESMAADAFPFAWGAVMLASVLSGCGFQAETILGSVVYSDKPELAALNLRSTFGIQIQGPVHGMISGNLPAVMPMDSSISELTVGDVTVRETVAASRIAAHLERALACRNAGRAFTDERLRLALELWSAHHKESSLRAKFLTLVMGLEVLAPPASKHVAALGVLDRWDKDLAAELEHYAVGSEGRDAIESLQREVLFRRERSIRSRLRKRALEVLGAVCPTDAQRIAQMAVRAYDLRGSLVHNGTIAPAELSEGYRAAIGALRALLLASFGICST